MAARAASPICSARPAGSCAVLGVGCATERHGAGAPAGLQNRSAVVARRWVGSIPAPLRFTGKSPLCRLSLAQRGALTRVRAVRDRAMQDRDDTHRLLVVPELVDDAVAAHPQR